MREYDKKKKASGGKLVDATPEIDAKIKQELEKVAKQFGGDAKDDMTKFPNITFQEPKLEEIDVKSDAK